ncbi:hypothetical protein [Flagellimonas okinawensis]|uniref:Uncharacterized protein n=1 Tax=Flagellimonas okinawensis TaxID=3031324 RepID=A0ABT5XRT5_9FLAO|nr:hypothetical protein [[Muricauda] okinawensis]MDF0708598.1 hypothetical protein [[Muricauda] okinawensis]
MDLRLNNMCRTHQAEDRLWSGKETEYKGTTGTALCRPLSEDRLRRLLCDTY